MLKYNSALKKTARRLRADMTDSEQQLWSRLRRKQVRNVQFYRQKPIGNYVVDFYAPRARLVIELDGSQHFQADQAIKDRQRDEFMRRQGLDVLRFNNLQVLKELDGVMAEIFRVVSERVGFENPP